MWLKVECDFHRLVKVKQDADRRERSDKNKDRRQRKNLMEPLDLVFSLIERLEKKDAPGKLYKSSTENKSFFNKKKV